jgi:hypothetical protein
MDSGATLQAKNMQNQGVALLMSLMVIFAQIVQLHRTSQTVMLLAV